MLPDYNVCCCIATSSADETFPLARCLMSVVLRMVRGRQHTGGCMMKFEREVTTTLAGNQPAKTKLAVIVDDSQAWDALALRAAVVAAQARWRKAGEVPVEETVTASELVGHRRGRKPVDPIARAKADPAYRRRLMAAIAAMDEEGSEQ
jgi:hypothetical protein